MKNLNYKVLYHTAAESFGSSTFKTCLTITRQGNNAMRWFKMVTEHYYIWKLISWRYMYMMYRMTPCRGTYECGK